MSKKNNKRDQKKGVFGHSDVSTVEQMVALYPDGYVASWHDNHDLDYAFVSTLQQGKMRTYSDGSFDFTPKRQIEGRPENFSYEILDKTVHGELREYAQQLVLTIKVNKEESSSMMRMLTSEFYNLVPKMLLYLHN